MSLAVALVEDDPRFRSSLETLFESEPGFRLGGSFGAADVALAEVEARIARGERPLWDVVLMDLELPRMTGIEATRRMKSTLPELRVVVFTVFEEPATILEAICAGADGYLLKRTPARELLSQLRAIVSGGAPLTASVARTVLEIVRIGGPGGTLATRDGAPTRLELTAREQEVLRGLVGGLGYRQVGDDLGISLDTVRQHIRSIYRKLQVHSVGEAVARAIREKLV
jgi:DNA-binding NarL/FixJ family response regulator